MAHNERAVSPVIGVLLMVTITVILAAAIGTFVLDLGQNVQSVTPSAGFELEDIDGPNVSVNHIGGNPIDTHSLTVKVNGSMVNPAYEDSEFEAGDSIEFPAQSGERILLIYKSNDRSTIIFERIV